MNFLVCFFFSSENSKNFTFVEIKLIDFGIIMNVKSTQLMELPSFLQIHPPGVVDLYLKDIIPFDGDETFDHDSTVHLKSLLKFKLRENCYNICDISFVLLDSIFANNIEIREYLPTTKCNLTVFSIKTHLLSTKRCCLDPDVSKNLQSLALECGIDTEFIPEVEEIIEVEDKVIETKNTPSTGVEKWQELELGSDYHVEVTMFDSIA